MHQIKTVNSKSLGFKNDLGFEEAPDNFQLHNNDIFQQVKKHDLG